MNKYNNDKFDIIIQAGQSNAEGYGIGKVTEEYIENENVLYYNGDFTITTAKEGIATDSQYDLFFGGNAENLERKVNNFSLSFAQEYIKAGKLQNGRKILIIRAAVGGTGFSDNRWGPADDLYLRMIKMIKEALALNPENRIVVFLWHQGETDAINKVTREVYYINLKRLLIFVQTYFACRMPFIAGDFVHEWKTQNSGICEPIITAIKDVCQDCGPAAFVETEGLNSNNQDTCNGDIIHFGRKAQNILGKRYFDAFTKLNEGLS